MDKLRFKIGFYPSLWRLNHFKFKRTTRRHHFYLNIIILGIQIRTYKFKPLKRYELKSTKTGTTTK